MNASETAYVESIEKEKRLLQDQVAHLAEQLEWFKRQVFGQRSEKIVPTDDKQLLLDIFGDLTPAEEEKKEIPAHQRRKRTKKETDTVELSPDLPIEQTILDVPEAEKVCPETGKPLVKIGEETTFKLAHKPGSFFVKQIIRPKYGLPGGEGVLCAELPESLLSRCQADESLLAEMLVNKFADHLPFYRCEEIYKRHGVTISRQKLSQWTIRSCLALKPLYQEMMKTILKTGNIFVDESPVSILAPGKGKAQQAYMWVVASQGLCAFTFKKDRKHINADRLLEGFEGVFHSDKYGAYERLAQRQGLTWCPCWAHIRRKFFEAETGDRAFQQWMLRHIRYLFRFERTALARPPDERLRIRQDKQIPLIDKMIEACKCKLREGKVLPKSKLRTALGYFCGLIPYLKHYAYHADARLDNNTAERVIRPLAIGRKNWLFVGSEDGGEAAAIAISLIQSCRSIGIDPRAYLEDVMRRIMSHPANKLSELLPMHWAENRAR